MVELSERSSEKMGQFLPIPSDSPALPVAAMRHQVGRQFANSAADGYQVSPSEPPIPVLKAKNPVKKSRRLGFLDGEYIIILLRYQFKVFQLKA